MTAKKNIPAADRPATLKMLADYLGLSPATVSIVLNNSPVAISIPTATKQRVHAAAKKFDYRPNLHARMLRTRLTNTIGVIVPELSEGYFTGVMLGVEQYLLQEGFLYFTVSHLGRADLKDEYQELLMRRRVDGFLLVNTQLSVEVPAPVVGVSSHSKALGVTNVMLDHNVAARMALRHLYDLGHRNIAFMKGQQYSLDSEDPLASDCRHRAGNRHHHPSGTLHLSRRESLVARARLSSGTRSPLPHSRFHRRLLLQRHLSHRRHPRHPGRRPFLPKRHLRYRLRRHRRCRVFQPATHHRTPAPLQNGFNRRRASRQSHPVTGRSVSTGRLV